MSKEERIKEYKSSLGSRHDRKLKKFSQSFNRNFWFFFSLVRKGVITFCGEDIKDKYMLQLDPEGLSCKEVFRKFEDGFYAIKEDEDGNKKREPMITRHPNIIETVLIGKKGWGLWTDQWTDGIAECSFQRHEIFSTFEDVGLEIPEHFMNEFENRLRQKQVKYFEFLKKNGFLD